MWVPRVPPLDERDCFAGVALGGSVLTEPGRVTVEAAGLGGAGEGLQVARSGEAGCRRPEPGRGEISRDPSSGWRWLASRSDNGHH